MSPTIVFLPSYCFTGMEPTAVETVEMRLNLLIMGLIAQSFQATHCPDKARIETSQACFCKDRPDWNDEGRATKDSGSSCNSGKHVDETGDLNHRPHQASETMAQQAMRLLTDTQKPKGTIVD
ncbi:MAG: hypothetical protein VKO39_05445 [Cyanobacteriota bacterium]|nr:hypothetical protein [Cyanobacteriota bacterium]